VLAAGSDGASDGLGEMVFVVRHRRESYAVFVSKAWNVADGVERVPMAIGDPERDR